MEKFYRELPQLRCTELQLKMRLASLHLQLKRVAHEQNTRLAVSSRVQRGSVADKVLLVGLKDCKRIRGSQNPRDLRGNQRL